MSLLFETKSLKNQRGFTLIEISIVIVIVGLMVAGFIQAYTIYEAKRKVEREELQMAAVDDAIKSFVSREGRLPCPAPMGGRRASPVVADDPVLDDGLISYNEEDCNLDGGTSNLDATGAGDVRIGKLPAATLEISSDLMKDVHGNYLIYAVSTAATSDMAADGAIIIIQKRIEDDEGAPDYGQIVEDAPLTGVQYIVFSNGSNGFGAYAYDGSQTFSDPTVTACDGAVNDEQENCDGDATFKVSIRSDLEDSALYYDDKASFVSNVAALLPEESTGCKQQESFMTNADECPDGWEAFPAPARSGGSSPLGEGVLVVGDTGRHYNIDPETGDYYFTSIPTPNTALEPSGSGGDGRLCMKGEENSQKTHCHTKSSTFATGLQTTTYTRVEDGDSGSAIRDAAQKTQQVIDRGDDNCPEGWTFLGISKRFLRSDSNRAGDRTYEELTAQCGQ